MLTRGSNMQPQNQTQAQPLLDPDTLQQMMASMSGSDQNQSTQNVLQLYQQAQRSQTINSQFGPPPQGMSQSQWNGLCEKWAEANSGSGQTGLYPTAIAAEQHYAQSGQLNPNVAKAPVNSLVYWSANQGNQNDGHVGKIVGYNSQGVPLMQSATYNGIQTTPIDQWSKSTGQQPLGFVIPK